MKKRLLWLGWAVGIMLWATSCTPSGKAPEQQRPSVRARNTLIEVEQQVAEHRGLPTTDQQQTTIDSLLVEEIEFFDLHEMFDELKRALLLRTELLQAAGKTTEARQYLLRGAALAEALDDEPYMAQICQRLRREVDSTLNEPLMRELLRAEHQVLRQHSFEDEQFPYVFVWSSVLIAFLFGCLFYYKTRLDNELQHEKIRRLREQIAFRDASEIQGLNRLREDDIVRRFRDSFIHQKSITAEDWSSLRQLFAEHYPSFEKRLRDVHSLSEVEWQVCMLLKLDFSPTDIAVLAARSQASISTIRSRLYSKFFLQKGSAADWDRFIASL